MQHKGFLPWMAPLGLLLLVSCGGGGGADFVLPDPDVVQFNPIDGESNVPLNVVVQVIFNQEMNPASINSSNFFLEGPQGSVPANLTYSSSDFTASLKPNGELDANVPYTATITAGVKAVNGVSLSQPRQWRFTTGKSPDTSPPQFDGVEKAVTKNASTITLYWSPAKDDHDCPDQTKPCSSIIYKICIATQSGICNALFGTDLVSSRTTDRGAISYDVTGLPPNNTYYFVVRAQDRAGNLDQNEIELSATLSVKPGRLYVANSGTHEILALADPTVISGDKIFSARIRSQSGTLGNPNGLFLDPANDRLYVSNFLANSVIVFEKASTLPTSGDIYPSRVIFGTLTALNGPTAIFVDSGDRLYVANFNTNSIAIFNNASMISGDLAPARTISGDQTLINNPLGLVVNTSDLYVANSGDHSILVFHSTDSGNLVPYKKIQGTKTKLSSPIGLALSSSELFVSNAGNNSIAIFDVSMITPCMTPECPEGDISPSRSIGKGSESIDNTRLSAPRAIILNSTLDRLYVSNSGDDSILIFNAAASENVPPLTFIIGEETGIRGPRGLGILGNKLYLANQDLNEILAFNLSLTTAPIARISSIGTTPLNAPLGLYLDSNRNELYVTNFLDNSIMVFANPNVISNNMTPVRVISGNLTRLNGPTGIFLDAVADPDGDITNGAGVLYVANFLDNSIVIFNNASLLSGNVAPNRDIRRESIVNDNTLIYAPVGLFVDTIKDLLYVSNRGDLTQTVPVQPIILIFDGASSRTGNLSPARTISGSDTKLNEPVGLFVDTTEDILYVANRQGNSILVFNNPSTIPKANLPPSRIIKFQNINGAKPNGLFIEKTGTANLNRVYATEEGNHSIMVFEDDTTITSTEPVLVNVLEVIQGTSTGLNKPFGITLDPNTNSLFVANSVGNSVMVFPDPFRLSSGGNTPANAEIPIILRDPRWLALDPGDAATGIPDELYVGSPSANAVMAFRNASQITGSVGEIPVRLLRGKLSKINQPQGIFLVRDRSTAPPVDRLYVANGSDNSILVFDKASTRNGEVPPTLVITSPVLSTAEVRGIAVDRRKDLLYVADKKNNSIYVFNQVGELTASKDYVTAFHTITPINEPIGIYLDEPNDRLYVASFIVNNPSQSAIYVFDNASTVDLSSSFAPRIIKSSLSTPLFPVGVFVDTLSTERPDGLDHLYVSSFNNNNPSQSAIYVFDNASTIQGTVTPIQNISGPTTGLNLPFGIVVDTTR